MSNLNISGRRIVEMWEVEEMINAVDDGDGNLSYEEFIQLIQQQNVTGTSANKSGDSEKKWIKTSLLRFSTGIWSFGAAKFFVAHKYSKYGSSNYVPQTVAPRNMPKEAHFLKIPLTNGFVRKALVKISDLVLKSTSATKIKRKLGSSEILYDDVEASLDIWISIIKCFPNWQLQIFIKV